MRPLHLSRVLREELKAAAGGVHTPVMLWGPPGVGKSQLVQQIGAELAIPITDVRLSQMEPSDLRGIPFKQGDRVEWAVPSLLPDAAVHGATGILFLDEINAAAPSVSAAAYQLILDRRLGAYEVPPGWAIFAAGNRQGDRGVTYAMPAPLANRFSHYEFEVHQDDWVAWAHRTGIDERIVGFLRFRPELLFDYDAAQSPIAFPSPRSWEFAHRALQKFSGHPELVAGSLQACVGEAAAVECHAFIESLEKLPDLDRIAAGVEVGVPEEIDLQYAVASALVRRAVRAIDGGEANGVVDAVLRYAARFPQREMGVMLVADLHRAVGEALFAFEGFADWADTIADLVLCE
jgi:hypothetical protein